MRVPVRPTRNTSPTLHLEWTPTSVCALDVTSGASSDAATISALGPILQGRNQVLVGIGRRAVFLKAVRLPKAAYEDVRRIVGVQLGQWFPLPPDQMAFDFLQTTDVNVEGCLTVVAAVRSDDLKRLLADLGAAGLTASRILPVALGAPAVAGSSGQADALVLENGPAGLALDVVRAGALQSSRLVPVGSDVAAEARRTLAAAQAGALPVVTAGGVAFPGALPSFGTALSLLHQAAPLFSFRLLEDWAGTLRKRAGDRTRLAALLLVSALLLATLVWADREQASAAQKKRDGAVARQMTRLQSIKDAAADKAQKVTDVQDVLSRAFSPAQPLSDVAAVVADSLPRGAWLTGLGLERGKPIEIRGAARSSSAVPQLVHMLGRSPRFRDVRLVFANGITVGKARVTEFEISAVAVGSLSLSAPDKTKAPQSADGGASAGSDSVGAGG